MKGTMSITSEKGVGSTFTVTLNDVKFSEKAIEREDDGSSQLNPAIKELSLLLVDDTPLNLKMLNLMCEKLGITKTRSAKNGKEALDLLQTSPMPDVVMTDIQMPVMDGMALVSEIRKNPNLSKLPVYAVTGDIEMLNTYQKDGFTGLLLKPYNIAKLTEFFNQIS
jgi:two-component system chemotaxis response regulator CheY